ncbi:thermonuclease family protein [Methylomicrobium sp. Wu6]|uniref:thermonuclease family protein n=1 Tax=Methylomicrobium sp. Wu6 TaxID=3107928 RepID=UPI002DD664AF|nr:thermonuclease family protein [Methylomicrobium sp. Wu6]MEC4749887.1 thermonuclease family protein [Methylomicrobium sp. Wu6]
MFKAILWFLIVFSGIAHSASRIEGRVVGIHDSDTLTLLVAGNQTVKIRLAQIDAPESDQAFGQKSRQSLAEMVFNKSVSVEKETVDKYGRVVGTVFADGIDVNKNQVVRGMAWMYRKYAHDKTLVQIEDNARQARAGLWSDPNPVPPWEYRHGGAKPTTTTGPAVTGTCGSKKYCKQMTSCDEAKQYLACGVSSLDKDGDGVPCESLCKN